MKYKYKSIPLPGCSKGVVVTDQVMQELMPALEENDVPGYEVCGFIIPTYQSGTFTVEVVYRSIDNVRAVVTHADPDAEAIFDILSNAGKK